MAETLSGVIDRITFHSEESGFAVLRVQTDTRRGLVTVVGTAASLVAGEYVEAVGDWAQDRDHGLQFKAESLRVTPPHTPDGLAKYLGSGMVKGIGPQYAKRIVERFGDKTLEVIDQSPNFLSEVKGIGPERVRRIRQSWEEQKAVRGIMAFLMSHGVGTARAVRIYKAYGEAAVETVRGNPYRLADDVWGFGFKTADDLARRLGLPADSPHRARAALRFVLKELNGEGHVGHPEEGVLARTGELTGIARPALEEAVEALRQSGDVVRDEPADGDAGPWLFPKPMFLAELGVARALTGLARRDHPLPAVDADAALAWVEAKNGVELAPLQRDAVKAALTGKVVVVTGGPGTGKTTIVRSIVDLFAAKSQRCCLCAPTGRAAKRLSESTGREAKTIHRTLEFDPAFGGFKRDRDNPLECDLVVVDEASMVDVVLMNQLLRAVPDWACLVLVGDVDQLPSVGAGAVLADVIRSGAVPVVRLTQIFRQAGESWIVRAAHSVNAGELPAAAPPNGGDFYVVEAAEPDAALGRVVTMVADRIPARFGLDPFRDVQVLSPMRVRSLGVDNLNARLQQALNPKKPGGKEVTRFATTFRAGDKVMQTRNNYQKDVFNGDIGRVRSIDPVNQEVVVEFEDRAVPYDFAELDELTLAYACSVHKSQGAEYPAVVIPVHTQHYVMLQRNLLYTGITRGKKLVVLVGTKKALSVAVASADTSRRYSMLVERLRAEAARAE